MHIIILITTKNVSEANNIATKLIESKLVACANIIRDIKSIFWWKGKVDAANEALLILKSKKECFPQIVEVVKSVHSYEVPEIIALPIDEGNKEYLNWVDENCSA